MSFGGFEGRLVGVIYSLTAIGSMLRPRWLPEKSFPPYAYLPGRQPHPVRDPAGHSYHFYYLLVNFVLRRVIAQGAFELRRTHGRFASREAA